MKLATTNMTAAEVAAWESMVRDGTFWRLQGSGNLSLQNHPYYAELRRRAELFEREVRA